MSAETSLNLTDNDVLILDGPPADEAELAVKKAGGRPRLVTTAEAVARLLAGEANHLVAHEAGQGAALFDAAAMDGNRTALRRRMPGVQVVALDAPAADGFCRLGVSPFVAPASGVLDGSLTQAPLQPATADFDQTPFMRACRRQEAPWTPLWLMRQAGRYMEEYRRVRARVSMLELCQSPDLVSEVTVHAAETLGVDAAIIFADLLLIVEPLGLKLEYLQGEGPAITPAVRTGEDVDRLREVEDGDLSYVWDAIRQTRQDLVDSIPLIGFAGAPFTVASYLVEGGASRNFLHTKRLMYSDEGAWNALMEKVVRGTIGFLAGQFTAGAQALQLFDSWVGCLSPEDYRRYVQPHTARLVAALPEGVPVIHFGTGTGDLLPEMRKAGGTVLGADWRIELDEAWRRVGEDVALMGNLDPLKLFGPWEGIEREVRRILSLADNRPGHIFNLGHGILPGTPVDHVRRLVDLVHEVSAR